MKPDDFSAIVTGASRGIGKAISIRLLSEGFKVCGVYLNDDKSANEISLKYPNFHPIKADVSAEKEVINTVKQTINKFGRIDILINNAGIDFCAKLESMDLKLWKKMLDVNVTSIFLMTKYCLPYLKKSGNPCIINISSRLGFINLSEPNFTAYSATKAAVNNLTVGLAKELKNSVRINAVIPAPTETDLLYSVFSKTEIEYMRKKGVLGQPQEVAELVYKVIGNRKVNGKLIIDRRIEKEITLDCDMMKSIS